MSEIPAHILEQLHYELDGTISADTEEAKAFVEKMGWNGEEACLKRRDTLPGTLSLFFMLAAASGTKHKKSTALVVQPFFEKIISDFKENNLPFWSDKIELELIEKILWRVRLADQSVRQDPQILAVLKTISEIYKAKLNGHFVDENLDEFYEKALQELEPTPIEINRFQSLWVIKYFSLQPFILKELNSNEIYFLGKNGEGKTLILQSFILAAKHAYITNVGNKERIGKVLECLDENPHNIIAVSEYENSAVIGIGETGKYISNIYAYGVHRHQYTGDKNDKDYDSEGFLTLFDSNKKLLSPDKWLLDLRLKELEAKDKGLEVMFTPTTAKKLLENLVKEEDGENTVSIEIDGIKGEVRYTERSGKPLRFHQLSAGYQSVMVWVADLVARMSEQQPEVKELADFEAIVLVDEVGVHLHPQWEYNIMKKLRGWFPKIQFIVTTHSPILLMGASEDAIIYRITKEDGVTKLVGSVPQSELRKMMANQIITSPLFGLDTMAPRSFELQNASNDDFIYQKIHEVIKQRLAENPTLDEDAILKWIEEEMNKLPSHNE